MKIVRKVDRTGCSVAFWLDSDGDIVGWCDGNLSSPEEQAAEDGGWYVGEEYAIGCGTTLAALRAELTEEGKDG